MIEELWEMSERWKKENITRLGKGNCSQQEVRRKGLEQELNALIRLKEALEGQTQLKQ